MSVIVVTDSSACLSPQLQQHWGIRVLPLHILVDGADLRDGIDDVPADIYQRDNVSTAAASPAAPAPTTSTSQWACAAS